MQDPIVHSSSHESDAPNRAAHAEPVSDEVERLEALLAQRAGELVRERAELGRLRGLLRDSLERFATLPPRGADPAELRSVRAEHARVLERALEAEAARTEAMFERDEALGHARIAVTAAGGLSAPVTLQAAPASPAPVVVPDEASQLSQARLSGTVRGLVAALAESEEARDMANARRLLVEHDLEDARERINALSRQLVEAREHAELADAQARALGLRLQGSLEARAASVLRGETLGLRARSTESEQALQALDSKLDESDRDAAELRQALGSARAELSALRSDSVAMQERIAQLDRAVARETENAREASGLATRQHAERLVLHDELARARSELLTQREAVEELRAHQQRASEQADADRSAARQAAADRHARAERMADALREARALLGELPAALARALAPEFLSSRDPTLPGTVSALEGATLTGESVEESLHDLEARVTEAIRVLRGLQDAPNAANVRDDVTALLRLLELA